MLTRDELERIRIRLRLGDYYRLTVGQAVEDIELLLEHADELEVRVNYRAQVGE